MHYLYGARFVFGHSLVELLEALVDRHAALATLRDAARQLDARRFLDEAQRLLGEA